MVDPIQNVVDAKSGYELALAIIGVFILGFAWISRKFFEITKTQDDKEVVHIQHIESINKAHVEQIERIYKENSDRVERLIEAHRTEILTAVDKLTVALHELHISIEKRSVRLTDNRTNGK
jgi:hypothetical protein